MAETILTTYLFSVRRQDIKKTNLITSQSNSSFQLQSVFFVKVTMNKRKTGSCSNAKGNILIAQSTEREKKNRFKGTEDKKWLNVQSPLMMCCFQEKNISFSLWALPQAGAAWRLNLQQKIRGCIFAVCIHNTEEADFCICLNGKPPYIMSAFARLSCRLLPISFSVYRGIKLCRPEMAEMRRNQRGNQHYSGLVQGNSKSTSKRPCSLFLKLSTISQACLEWFENWTLSQCQANLEAHILRATAWTVVEMREHAHWCVIYLS